MTRVAEYFRSFAYISLNYCELSATLSYGEVDAAYFLGIMLHRECRSSDPDRIKEFQDNNQDLGENPVSVR